MSSLSITTLVLGCGLAAIILHLIRRDHLYLTHGLFWMLIAAVAALLGVRPALIDTMANIVGIQYPPAALLLGASIVLFLKALHADTMNTRLERQLRRLNQRLAMLEAEVSSGEDKPTRSQGQT